METSQVIFIPEAIQSRFMKKGSARSQPGFFEIRKHKTLFRIDKRDVWIHLSLLLIFFISRGEEVKKYLKGIDKQWVRPLTFICSKYGTLRKRNSMLKSNTITLSRLADCYSPIVCLFLKSGLGKTFVNMSFLEDNSGCKIPRAMLNRVFAGLLPMGSIGDVFENILKVYLLLLEVIHSPKSTIDGLALRVDKVERYIQDRRNSTFIPEADRLLCLQVLELVNEKNEPIPDILKLDGVAKKVWKMIKGSHDFVSVIEEMKPGKETYKLAMDETNDDLFSGQFGIVDTAICVLGRFLDRCQRLNGGIFG
ncbi:hypothetical protein JTB14_030649 [Gonioctena quinquepunctata]|nr:hypothetical protein JTB14_030649 [Gonioctena quinquepunctata]